jgi:hypothetical protein
VTPFSQSDVSKAAAMHHEQTVLSSLEHGNKPHDLVIIIEIKFLLIVF